MLNPPEVIWSHHAVERGEQRFGDCCGLTFPDALIQVVACCKQVGETFKVGQGGVVYVCVLASETQVVVKTVHEATTGLERGARGNGRLATDPHNRAIRGKLDRRTQRTRASFKRELEQLYLPGRGYCEIGELDSPGERCSEICPDTGHIQERQE
jgi:hypothetical protein